MEPFSMYIKTSEVSEVLEETVFNSNQQMGRVSICEKTGLKRGKWTAEEDQLLTSYIMRYGHWNWRELPKHAGLSRCGKSCRLRWLNYLRPNIKRGNYTKEEEELIIKLHQQLGNRWSAIAASLPGRTDNEIKNHWHTHLRKHKKRNTISKELRQKPEERQTVPSSVQPATLTYIILESSDVLPASVPSSSEFASYTSDSESVILESRAVADESEISSNAFVELDENFWTDSLLVEGSYEEDSQTSQQSEISFDDGVFWTEAFSVKDQYKSENISSTAVLGSDDDFWTNASEVNEIFSNPVLEFDENFWTEPFQVEEIYKPVDPSIQFSVTDAGKALYLNDF